MRISAAGDDCPFYSLGGRRPSRSGIRCEREVTNMSIKRADSCKLSGAVETTVCMTTNRRIHTE